MQLCTSNFDLNFCIWIFLRRSFKSLLLFFSFSDRFYFFLSGKQAWRRPARHGKKQKQNKNSIRPAANSQSFRYTTTSHVRLVSDDNPLVPSNPRGARERPGGLVGLLASNYACMKAFFVITGTTPLCRGNTTSDWPGFLQPQDHVLRPVREIDCCWGCCCCCCFTL